MKNTPPLWPGFDPNAGTRFAAAWRDLWKVCGSSVPEDLTMAGLANRHPDLKAKTLSNLIGTAIRNGHIERTRSGRIRRTKRASK